MDIVQELSRSTPRGPFGSLQSGDASEGVIHFPDYRRLRPEDQVVINRVWSGRLRKCLVPSLDGASLYYVEYTPAGQERAGVRYGYTVRTVATGAGSTDTAGSVPSPSPARIALVLLLAVCVGGSVAGVMLWRNVPRPQPNASIHSQPAGPPAVTMAAPVTGMLEDSPAKLVEIELRERAGREVHINLDAAEVKRLRAVIEAEAKQLRSRASALEAGLTRAAAMPDSSGLIDEQGSEAPPLGASSRGVLVRNLHGGCRQVQEDKAGSAELNRQWEVGTEPSQSQTERPMTKPFP
jgi:hypothetical protein